MERAKKASTQMEMARRNRSEARCKSTTASFWVSDDACLSLPRPFRTKLIHSATIPPPFNVWERYYIIPPSINDTLKLSLDLARKESLSSPRIDLSGLVQDADGELVRVIGTAVDSNGTRTLSNTGQEERLWSIKEGLVENTDFMFVSEAGWNHIVEW